MRIEITPDSERKILALIHKGEYRTPEEVVRAGIMRLNQSPSSLHTLQAEQWMNQLDVLVKSVGVSGNPNLDDSRASIYE